MTDPVLIRNLAPGDIPYVFATYLRDLRDADASALPDDLWFAAHRTHLERALGDRSLTTLIAAAADAPDEILGFVIASKEKLVWVQIRKGLRRQGLAKRLLLQAGVDPQTPAEWMTPLGRQRLPNPRRSRQLRRRTSTGIR